MEGACDATGVLQANHLHCAAVGQGRHQRSEVGLQEKRISVATAVLWRSKKQMLGQVLPSGTWAAALCEEVTEGEERFGAEAQGWQECMAHASPRHGAGCLNTLATEPAARPCHRVCQRRVSGSLYCYQEGFLIDKHNQQPAYAVGGARAVCTAKSTRRTDHH